MAGGMVRCLSCGAKPSSRLALYCSKCGTSLVARYEIAPGPTATPSAWKSVPALVRLGVWLIVLPPLLAFGSRAACTLLAALSGHR
jgi:hypothetical protein